jgi:hypothetical protein
MDYYIYTNWQAKNRLSNKIHHWSCGDCRMGLGKHREANTGENGVWIGPFKNRKQAREFSETYFQTNPITNCSRCNKK